VASQAPRWLSLLFLGLWTVVRAVAPIIFAQTCDLPPFTLTLPECTSLSAGLSRFSSLKSFVFALRSRLPPPETARAPLALISGLRFPGTVYEMSLELLIRRYCRHVYRVVSKMSTDVDSRSVAFAAAAVGEPPESRIAHSDERPVPCDGPMHHSAVLQFYLFRSVGGLSGFRGCTRGSRACIARWVRR